MSIKGSNSATHCCLASVVSTAISPPLPQSLTKSETFTVSKAVKVFFVTLF